MRQYDIITGLFLLVVALAICGGSFQLHVGSFSGPGPGFFPLMTGLALGIFSILILVGARKLGKEPVKFWVPGGDKKGIYLAFVFILVYPLLLERLGFIGTTVIFFFLISRFVSGHSWITAIFFGLVASLSIYFIFTFLLHAPLPQGIVESIF